MDLKYFTVYIDSMDSGSKSQLAPSKMDGLTEINIHYM